MYEPMNGGAFGTTFLVIGLALYFYFTLAQFMMARKTGHHSPWWAFVPILNAFQLIQMAGKPWYWFFLCLVPVVNIVCFAIIMMDVARACHKSPVWGILCLLPFVNFVSYGVLAFANAQNAQTPFPAHQPELQQRPEPQRQPENVP